MSRKSLPVVGITMILVIALATMGLAYGLWSETLTIDGTVYTGEVDLGFSGPKVWEWVDVNGKPQLEPPVKDQYAECTAKAYDYDPNSDGLEGITIEVKGAYPSYHCAIWFDVTNLGSIPVHVSHPKGTAPSWVKVKACYPDPYQLHPGKSVWAWILIHFTNQDGVNENDKYTFHFDIEGLQWNEALPEGEGLVQECFELPPLEWGQ